MQRGKAAAEITRPWLLPPIQPHLIGDRPRSVAGRVAKVALYDTSYLDAAFALITILVSAFGSTTADAEFFLGVIAPATYGAWIGLRIALARQPTIAHVLGSFLGGALMMPIAYGLLSAMVTVSVAAIRGRWPLMIEGIGAAPAAVMLTLVPALMMSLGVLGAFLILAAPILAVRDPDLMLVGSNVGAVPLRTAHRAIRFAFIGASILVLGITIWTISGHGADDILRDVSLVIQGRGRADHAWLFGPLGTTIGAVAVFVGFVMGRFSPRRPL